MMASSRAASKQPSNTCPLTGSSDAARLQPTHSSGSPKSQRPFRSARLPPPLQPQMLRQLTMSVNPARPDQPLPLGMAVPVCAIPVTRPPRRRHTPKLQFPLAPGSCELPPSRRRRQRRSGSGIRGQALPPALPGGSAIGVEASQRAEAVLVARAVVTWHQRATLTRATHLPAMLGRGDTTDGRAYTIEGSSTELGYFLCNIPADENVSAATAKIPRAHVVAAPGCQNSSLVVRLPQGRHGAHPQPAHRITDLTIACRARNNGTSPRARSPTLTTRPTAPTAVYRRSYASHECCHLRDSPVTSCSSPTSTPIFTRFSPMQRPSFPSGYM